MGKGKGKLNNWGSKYYPGTIFIEFQNVRYGRLNYFRQQLNYRLQFKSLLINNYTKIKVTSKIGTFFSFKLFFFLDLNVVWF